ncbi:MAG: DUF3883 domain-containing protein [Desulfovibrionaceae bacterium]|nr:DUF3883 domain-containing protein [Desulfovibrionaceae bacterium]
MSILFVNCGWMRYYSGVNNDDTIMHPESGFEHLKSNNNGGEQYNFFPLNGNVYGYAALIKKDENGDAYLTNINIKKLGNKIQKTEDNAYIDNITIVFFSRNPAKNNAYIVGWYIDARVYATPIDITINGYNDAYYFTTRSNNACLVPVEKRNMEVPHSRKIYGGYGQSALWYAERLPNYVEKVKDYIYKYTERYRISDEYTKGKSKNENDNIIDKDEIEKIAVDKTIKYYQDKGYNVESVENLNCGWDFTVTKDNEELFVEVKGTSFDNINVTLTPNEYSKLKEYYKKYRLFIVTNCPENPLFHIFRIENKDNKYFAKNSKREILLMESISAICREEN